MCSQYRKHTGTSSQFETTLKHDTMTFSKEEMEILSKYEQYFHTATKANYTRNPGRTALQEMHSIFKSATNSAIRLNTGCGHCIYSLVKAVAVAYYKDKEELAKAEEMQLKKVKAEDIPAETKEKVQVKTKTRKSKKAE